MPLRTIRPPSTVGAAWLTLQARASAKWAGWSICETVAAGGYGWEVWLLSTACAARLAHAITSHESWAGRAICDCTVEVRAQWHSGRPWLRVHL